MLHQFFFTTYIPNNIVIWIPSVRFRLWYYRTVVGMTIGSDTLLRMGCRFIGDRIKEISIGRGVAIAATLFVADAQITLGDYVMIAHNVELYTTDHDPDDPAFSRRNAPITINDRAWVGSSAIILKGVTIGEGAVVAAGSVVTEDVAPYTIVGGNPAKFVRERRAREFTYTHTLENLPPWH